MNPVLICPWKYWKKAPAVEIAVWWRNSDSYSSSTSAASRECMAAGFSNQALTASVTRLLLKMKERTLEVQHWSFFAQSHLHVSDVSVLMHSSDLNHIPCKPLKKKGAPPIRICIHLETLSE